MPAQTTGTPEAGTATTTDEGKRGIQTNEIAEVTDKAAVGKQWLVLIAINAYDDWIPLSGPVSDAEDLRETLIERYRIDEVVEIYDVEADKEGILEVFEDLALEVKPHDSVLIYYAGHGHYDEASGSDFWIPADGGSDTGQQENWLPNEQIRGYIRNLPSRHVLLIADACFAGDILDIKRSAAPEIKNGYFRRAYERVSRQVLTSGALETVPDASSFALNLRNELRGNRKPLLDPLMLFTAVRTGVRGTLPLYGNLRDSGHQTGGSFLLFLDEDEEAAGKRREKFRIKREEKQSRRRTATRLSVLLPGLGDLYNADYLDGALFTGVSVLLLSEYVKLREQFAALERDVARDADTALAANSLGVLALAVANQQNRYDRLREAQNRANLAVQLYALYWGYHLYRGKDRAVFLHENGTPHFSVTGDGMRWGLTVPY